ncbi:Ethanolamine-phosphate cytidylyltransferase [Pseudolycoriella hygida]|uniref:ethanolamine-phosphate cytidylyltransferase n=1 Tax=Pseudolycoriella hygida TaxID=35572 RepID=A0A9Q0NC60_9DIPT|nr:Ethanolamine-phosphate cytidylyltransferase [Pseudolycoriella hygida]
MQFTKETRVWVDGCYDITHFGHANMLRQAKNLGTKLIVGVHSDEDIRRVKRPPVYSQNERVKMVKAIKWTDEVIESAPYKTSIQTLNDYNCDFAVHGDDKSTDNGEDTYDLVKKAKRYVEVPRTAGISTTGLIKRILRRSTFDRNDSDDVVSQYTGMSPFLQTTRKIYEFTKDGCNYCPQSTDKIIYVAGTFDLFHVGHLDFLERAKSLGDYLIVGLHEDDTCILTLSERVMNLLACKYVNEVVVNAPKKVTFDVMDHFNVHQVYHGRFFDSTGDYDPYEIPKKMGKFDRIDSRSDVTTEQIIQRIKRSDEEYRSTNKTKEENEMKYQ